MSGFAFQKLNGGQTTANKQLEEQKAINEKLAQIILQNDALIDSSDKPDLWRMAKLYAPDKELIPISWSWIVNHASHTSNAVRNSNKSYYGKLTITIDTDDAVANSGRTMAILEVISNNKAINFFKKGFKGDNGFAFDSGNYTFTGIFDTLVLKKFSDRSYSVNAAVYFEGFEINDVDTEYVPEELEYYELIVGNIQKNCVANLIFKKGTEIVFTIHLDTSSLPISGLLITEFDSVTYEIIEEDAPGTKFQVWQGAVDSGWSELFMPITKNLDYNNKIIMVDTI